MIVIVIYSYNNYNYNYNNNNKNNNNIEYFNSIFYKFKSKVSIEQTHDD